MSISQTGDFFDFSKWRPPPPWVFKISNFLQSKWSRGSNCVTMPNLWQLVKLLLRYGEFSIYQNGGRRHLGLLKF